MVDFIGENKELENEEEILWDESYLVESLCVDELDWDSMG
jgi:hypothetical protein